MIWLSVVTSAIVKEKRLSFGCQHIPRLTGEEVSVQKWEGGTLLSLPGWIAGKHVAEDPAYVNIHHDFQNGKIA